tara:strand:- start:2376 stop:2549 length:174 start_codon:yes stop_codon:yes gene_type:complete
MTKAQRARRVSQLEKDAEKWGNRSQTANGVVDISICLTLKVTFNSYALILRKTVNID